MFLKTGAQGSGIGTTPIGRETGRPPQNARTMQKPCAEVNMGMGMAARPAAHFRLTGWRPRPNSSARHFMHVLTAHRLPRFLPMDSLKTALDRLAKAVDRLENAAAAREERVVKREQELTESLREARVEQARAQETAEAVSKRLEAAIGRLEAVMEN